jgi:histidine ammonia-lyase
VTSPPALLLDGNGLTLEDMESVARHQRAVGVAPAARAGVARAR